METERPFRILVHFPTRGRREQFIRVLGLYQSMAEDNDSIHYQVVADNDDITMRPELFKTKPKGVSFWYGDSKTKIEACNAFVDECKYKWDILVLASDDMFPMQGWDSAIRRNMNHYFPDLSGVLHFHDQHQKDNINTFSVMGRGWYQRFGYVYNPIYRTMYCDTEYTDVTRMFRKVAVCAENIIEHRHPYSGAAPMDEVYLKNNDSSFDAEIYSRRKANNFFLKRVLIIQPGRSGDILINLPIAKHYSDQNMIVYWLCPAEYHSLFRYIDYVFPVTQAVTADITIDLSFGFGGAPERWWNDHKKSFFSFVEAKYYLAGVNLKNRWNLVWKRNYRKEMDIFRKLNLTADNYILIHDTTHSGKITDIDVQGNIVEFREIEDFNIFDWYTVIACASEVHCIDSALSNFIEGCPGLRTLPKTIYLYCRETDYYLRALYRNGWNINRKASLQKAIIPASEYDFDLIIPCYKRPELLKALLDSLVFMPDKKLRIIFSLDGDDSEIKNVIEDFRSKAGKTIIYVITNKHQGISKTLLAAFQYCYQAQCIITLDSDFVVNKHFFPEIEKAVQTYGNSNTIFTGFNANSHRVIGLKDGYRRKQTIGGGNLCFTWDAAEKHVIPSLIGNMWDFQLSDRVRASGGDLLCITPSICQHMGDNSTLGHHRVDKANDFNY